MKTKQKLVIGLILTTLILTQTMTAQAGELGKLEVSTENSYLNPGKENTIKVILKKMGDFPIYDVEAFLTSANPGISIIQDYHKLYEKIDDSRSYEPIIFVDQNVPIGSYTLTLTIFYRRTSGSVQDQRLDLPIVLVVNDIFKEKIEFISSQTDLKVRSGTDNKVSLKFTNDGEQPLVNITYQLSSASNLITIIDGINYGFAELNSKESLSIQPTLSIVDGAKLGTYSISAYITYGDMDGNKFHQTFNIPINVDSAEAPRDTLITLTRMGVVQDSVKPGSVFDLELELVINGADAYEVLSSISFGPVTSISPLSPTIISLGDLKAGETTTVSYKVLSSGDIKAGQYPLTATISYTNTRGVSKTLIETMTIMVDGLIEFELLDSPTTRVSIGENAEVEVDLLLVGTESVQFVSIDMVEDDVFKRVRGSTEYIGAIDPDSPIPFDLDFKVDEDAREGDYTMELKITYRDHLNKEHETYLEMDIEVSGELDREVRYDAPTGIWAWIRRLLGLGP